jgi:hypothetical protein
MILGLAITFALLAAMFLYVRQKFFIYEQRLDLLSNTVQTMAGITRASLTDHDSVEEIDDESDNESECESENDHYEVAESEQGIEHYENIIHIEPENVEVKEVVFPQETEVRDPTPEKRVVSDDIVVKKIDLPTPWDSLSVKELKEKVAELNGPKLKTKRELIDFLQNKI